MNSGRNVSWDLYKEVSLKTGIELWKVKSINELMKNDNTIPFIARYRRTAVGNLDADTIRRIDLGINDLEKVKKEANTLTVKMEKNKIEDKGLKEIILSSKSLDELNEIKEQIKTVKTSKNEKAKKLKLEPITKDILSGCLESIPQSILENTEYKEDLLLCLIINEISVNADVIQAFKSVFKQENILVVSTKREKKEKKSDFSKCNPEKFKKYYTFKKLVKYLQNYEILALLRGEKVNELSVKFTIDERYIKKFLHTMLDTTFKKALENKKFCKLLSTAITKSLHDKLLPTFYRKIKAKLKAQALDAACDVFSKNCKELLLTPPIKGMPVLGIDPGYHNGNKMALISSRGELVETGKIFFNSANTARKLPVLLKKHYCSIIAIGNGCGSRKIEEVIALLIKNGSFSPLQVKYTIVNEQGTSIYSISDIAQEEFPTIDPLFRSAISIARRLQDPLAEWVKLNPKNFGVGMFQHDCPNSKLQKVADSVVEECVSFVGVDVNVASEYLLSKVSGLNNNLAKKIVAFRNANGFFLNRNQLMQIKGFGKKSFQLSAGFIKILPTSTYKGRNYATNEIPSIDLFSDSDSDIVMIDSKKTNKKAVHSDALDATIIHPESYAIAQKVLKILLSTKGEIGSEMMAKKIVNLLEEKSLSQISKEVDSDENTVQLILEAFSMSITQDIRSNFPKPVFKENILSVDDLHLGMHLNGVVRNVTDFAAFIDCGLNNNVYVHINGLKKLNIQLKLHEKVTLQITLIDKVGFLYQGNFIKYV